MQKTEEKREDLAFVQVTEEIMVKLALMMDEETQLIKSRNLEALGGLREKKARLARDYQINIETLARRPELLRDVPIEKRARMKVMGQKLDEATRRNVVVVEAALGATRALVQTVIDAAKKNARVTDSYTDPRKSPLLLGSYSPTSEPLAINRTA